MRRYTPDQLTRSLVAGRSPDPPPPRGSVGAGFGPAGFLSVHSGAFSLASRFADAYSPRTLLQSHCSSSAIIMAHAVQTPCPSSVCPMRIVTVSSGATTTHALISGTDGSRYQGAAGVATFTA